MVGLLTLIKWYLKLYREQYWTARITLRIQEMVIKWKLIMGMKNDIMNEQ